MFDRIKSDASYNNKFWHDHGLDLEREKISRSCMPSRLMKLFLPTSLDDGDEYNQSTSSANTSLFSFAQCDDSDLIGEITPTTSRMCRLGPVQWDKLYYSNHIHGPKRNQGTSFESPQGPSSTVLNDFVKLNHHFPFGPAQQCYVTSEGDRPVCYYCQRQLSLDSSNASVTTVTEDDDPSEYLNQAFVKKEVTWADDEGMSLLCYHILPSECDDYYPIPFREVRLEI